ncbi:class I SAM-dependent methyltransferase [Sphingosinicella sp. CPCC 101087]|uniref:class I SAM-dependent methyltransferase n=1 Tax=Sphingosinicella sp. CPCC 101087 TaxID=2497754 RepID=UPI00101C960B|nr:class I SAM-dependent methyltransferase [Sphingosinicella sp. CPCC 101087]
MTGAAVDHRGCPACGDERGRIAVASDPAAETLAAGQLHPFWSGLSRNKVFFSYRRCDGCGLLYNPLYFSAAMLAGLYADLEPNMDMVPREMVQATQRGYFEAAAAAGELSGGYLEIGPDVGHVVAEAAARGDFEHFWLYEPNGSVHHLLAEAARGRPATIICEMQDLSGVPDGSVGLAMMIHVLDHMIDPLAAARQIVRKLRPGGMLVIVTHNEASFLRRMLGKRWPPFCLQHPQLFNPRTMRSLLGWAGYERIEVVACQNVFPSDFLLRQAAQAAGLRLDGLPLPSIPLRLRLGNMLTLARSPLLSSYAAIEARERALERA